MLSALIVLGLVSCSDWGAEDPPAGTDVYPTYSKIFSYGFNDEENDPTPMDLYSYTDGDGLPAVVNDELAGMVLYTADGCARFANPLNGSGLDKGVNGYAALTFLVKMPCIADEEGNPTKEYDRNTVIASFQSMDGNQKLNFDANGGLVYDGPDGDVAFNTETKTGMLDNPEEWHSVAIQVTENGYFIYVDGMKKVNENSGSFDMKKVAAFMKNAPYIYINNGSNADKYSSFYIDDFAFYRGKLKDADLKDKRPGSGGGDEPTSEFFAPIYFQSFDGGAPDCEIVGGGQFMFVDQLHGMVFKNKTGEIRTNYLKMPSDLFVNLKDKSEATICFWVNKGSEAVSFWSPLFTAYGGAPTPNNTFPMLACQTRGVLQINNAGWSDYTDAQNVNNVNTLTTEWLDDAEWHLYCATFTPTTAAVYVDGEVINAWELDGDNTAAGLFTDGDKLNYICLGGNQAWDWGDVDQGFMFDDFALYDHCISVDQMKAIMASKKPSYMNTFENNGGDAQIFGDGSFDNIKSAWGTVFKNAIGGMRTNYCMIPNDVFAKAAGNEAITVGFWVNKGNQSVDMPWYPLFSAYGAQNTVENGMPMFMCQSRLLLQINNNGWSDYTNEQNLNLVNVEQNDWIKDGEWHYYTLTLTPTTACIYIDGEVMNAWEIDGVNNTAAGFFSNAADYKVISLGGNQAWNWGDPDPGFWFDDFVVYDRVCTQSEIKNILMSKKASK